MRKLAREFMWKFVNDDWKNYPNPPESDDQTEKVKAKAKKPRKKASKNA